MPKFKITVAYDGTGFVGWQRQAAGTSIQSLLEDALRELDGRDVMVVGAGRTDAGVHALGQVAAFDLEREITPAVLLRAVNARLPPAVRVTSAEEAAADFHARFGARAKTYRYRVWNGDVLSPFDRQYAWHVAAQLDVDRMAQAARFVEGRHDFAAFQAAGSDTKSTQREVFVSRIICKLSTTEDTEDTEEQNYTPIGFPLSVLRGGELIEYEITGDGFLRHMVRTIVGMLVEIGRGARPVEFISDAIESRNRAATGPTAPPEGLFLVRVTYDGERGETVEAGSRQACG
jgi:tRNA pseudouridine38-40 synthase